MKKNFSHGAAGLIIVLFLLAGCGNRTPLSLKEYEKPPTPKDISAIQREDYVTLRWAYENTKNVKSSIIEREKDEEGFRVIARAVNATVYTGRIEPGRKYVYRVRARSFTNVLGNEAWVSIKAMEPPAPPGNPGFSIGDKLITLSWQSQPNIIYNVYRKTASGTVLLNPAPVSGNTFKVAPMPNQAITYMVTAMLGGPHVYEGKAAQVTVTPEDFVPSKPVGLDAVPTPEGVRLIWQPNPEAWVKGYRIYKETCAGTSHIADSSIPTFLDEGEKQGTYRVSAIGPVSEGPLSDPVKISLPK
ncbi:MAG: hypothetical protein M0Z59_01715 [Nitrospiraceae bacterium]|nr:hypothetical protein [Nitrospiraceae bacterium]